MTEKSVERLEAEAAEARRRKYAADAEARRLDADARRVRARDGLDRLTPAELGLVEDMATDSVYGTSDFSIDWGNVRVDCNSPAVKDTLRNALRKLLGRDHR